MCQFIEFELKCLALVEHFSPIKLKINQSRSSPSLKQNISI